MSNTAPVREAYEAMRDAMVLGDVTELDRLLDDEFTLTHMTTYVQPKAEWLTDIDADQMKYHSIDDVELAVAPVRDGGMVLTVQTMTEATIWGAYGTWRLQLRFTYEERGGEWIATRCVATNW